jgi:hypothetical protein
MRLAVSILMLAMASCKGEPRQRLTANSSVQEIEAEFDAAMDAGEKHRACEAALRRVHADVRAGALNKDWEMVATGQCEPGRIRRWEEGVGHRLLDWPSEPEPPPREPGY